MDRSCPRSIFSHVFSSAWKLSLLALAVGCSNDDGITRYEVSSQPSSGSPHNTAVAPAAAPNVGSPHAGLTPAVKLTYETPEGWTPGDVGGMRKAAFVVQDGERRVDITAIDLAARAGALLPNVNRWRQQIQLGATTDEELADASSTVEVDGIEGTFVELIGPEDAEQRQTILGVILSRGSQAWFFKLWGDVDLAQQEKDHFLKFVKSVSFRAGPPVGHGAHAAGSATAGSPHGMPDDAIHRMPKDTAHAAVPGGGAHGAPMAHGAATSGGKSPLSFTAPESWQEESASGMRKAAFKVVDGEKSVEITAIDLSAAAGGLLPNVNRWRQQVQLEEVTQEELEASSQTIDVHGTEGHFVELISPEGDQPQQAILGVVAVRDDKAWFFKLIGDAELAQREKERFQNFVKSIQFTSESEVKDGQ